MVCGVDPSAERPGYAVWSTDPVSGQQAIVWAAVTPPPYPVDVIACESGWAHGPMGKLQMWGLGLDCGWRLRGLADASPNAVVYTIAPKAWRAALGGLPANAPKEVIVARLRMLRYRGYVNAESWTDDVVEACGIAEAAAIILSRLLKKNREELKEVKEVKR